MFKPVLNSQDDLDELLSNAAKELDVNGIRSLAEKYRSVSSTHIDALVDFPHNSHLMFHLIVLIFLQNNLTSSSLNILDVGVGGGEFNYLGKKMGHNVISTEVPKLLGGKNIHNSKEKFYSELRSLLGVRDLRELLVVPGAPLLIKEKKYFDVVTINSSTIQVLDQKFGEYGDFEGTRRLPAALWKGEDWLYLFEDIFDNILNSNGLLIINFGTPYYYDEGQYLGQFHLATEAVSPLLDPINDHPFLVLSAHDKDKIHNLNFIASDTQNFIFDDVVNNLASRRRAKGYSQ